MVQTFKTVGELKEFLEHLPDDMVVVHYKSDMEKSGWFEGVTPWVTPMKRKLMKPGTALMVVITLMKVMNLLLAERKW